MRPVVKKRLECYVRSRATPGTDDAEQAKPAALEGVTVRRLGL